jgi:hypothetical protein
LASFASFPFCLGLLLTEPIKSGPMSMALGENSHECIFVSGDIGQVSSFKKSNGKIFFVGLLQSVKQESFFRDLFLHFLDLFVVVCGSSDDFEENGFVLFFG